jgi:hypothetical protein
MYCNRCVWEDSFTSWLRVVYGKYPLNVLYQMNCHSAVLIATGPVTYTTLAWTGCAV